MKVFPGLGGINREGIFSNLGYKESIINFKQFPTTTLLFGSSFVSQMPSYAPPFVPLLPLRWQKLCSSSSGKEEQAVITGCKHNIHFLTQRSTMLLPTNPTSSSILRSLFNLFMTSSESLHDSLPFVTTVGEKLM